MSDIASIKQKSIIAYLSSLGFEPKKNGIKTAIYLCPWRGEKEPSLAIYKNTNTFCDWGTKEGGSIIELVQKLHDVDFIGALRLLDGNNVKNVTVMPQRIEEPAIKIISIGEITSDFLIQYLQKRCISLSVARKYCKQLRVELHKDDNTTYRKTMIGFQSKKGGWELRNKFSKIGTSPKYYSIINDGHEKAIVFEGFMDLLSFIELYGEPAKYTLICLNSVSFVDYIDWKTFKGVLYFGDNDDSGQRCMEKIQESTFVQDIRYLFHPDKDLNAYLIKMMEFKNEFLNKRLL